MLTKVEIKRVWDFKFYTFYSDNLNQYCTLRDKKETILTTSGFHFLIYTVKKQRIYAKNSMQIH